MCRKWIYCGMPIRYKEGSSRGDGDEALYTRILEYGEQDNQPEGHRQVPYELPAEDVRFREAPMPFPVGLVRDVVLTPEVYIEEHDGYGTHDGEECYDSANP